MKAIKLQVERKKVEKRVINGVEFFVGVSPYFFPERLECGYDKSKGACVIAFGYLDNEPEDPSPYRSDHLLEISVGLHTRRIKRITIHVDRNKLDRIDMLIFDEIPKALQAIGVPSERPDIAWNYKLAEDAVIAHRQEFASFAFAQ